MPYSKAHKENSRRRILDSAVKLFAAQGYDAVTLDQVEGSKNLLVLRPTL
ncbi:TetR family transcriptional regulator [Komagataeibacter sp. AV436]|uniref:TetR family transcriptional regulator n=1 Tax=Komagataeibacter melomenusus TaxID=2766578 RepID=A0ABX2AEL2_9PROT|nr:TetR family transcriptional regulator [Komagataeibacter melomenusus]